MTSWIEGSAAAPWSEQLPLVYNRAHSDTLLTATIEENETEICFNWCCCLNGVVLYSILGILSETNEFSTGH